MVLKTVGVHAAAGSGFEAKAGYHKAVAGEGGAGRGLEHAAARGAGACSGRRGGLMVWGGCWFPRNDSRRTRPPARRPERRDRPYGIYRRRLQPGNRVNLSESDTARKSHEDSA